MFLVRKVIFVKHGVELPQPPSSLFVVFHLEFISLSHLSLFTSELTVHDLLDHSAWLGGVTQPRPAGVEGADQLGHSFLHQTTYSNFSTLKSL